MQLNNMNGIEGQVTLVGYKAVAAMFLRWSLERRGKKDSVEPSWTFHAVLSFQKDSLLNNSAIGKRITVKLQGSEWVIEPLDGVAMQIDQNRLVIEGVRLCRAEAQQ